MKDLTEMEQRVLEKLLQGKNNRDIARSLKISEKTVEKHLTSIYHKLEVSGRAEAIVLSYSEMAKKAEAKGKR